MPHKAEGAFEHVGGVTLKIFHDLTDFFVFIGDVTLAIVDAIRHPSKIRWRETLYYMDMCGSDGLPITSMICFLMGVILGYQSAVQMHKYGADIYLPALVGCSIARELGPLMVAVVATGRAGSAFAAEIGTMKVSEEIDAMLTMGFVPFRFLVIPKLIAMVLMLPLLTAVADIVGIAGGMLVASTELGMPHETYYSQIIYWVLPRYIAEGIFKSIVFAVIITCVSCMRGFETGNDSIAVGRAATSSVVTSIFLIIIADALMTIIFNSLYFN